MDGRTRIAFSGIAAFAVTATVVATVVTTNAAAFADSPGAAIGAPAVDVHAIEASAAPTAASPSATPVPTPSIDVITETVPAPAPVDIDPTPVVPVAPTTPISPTETVDEPVSAEDAAFTEWATARGWSRDRIDRFLAKKNENPSSGDWAHEDEHDGFGRHDEEREHEDPPVDAGFPTVTESPQRGDGSKRDRSHGSPDHRD